MLKIAVLVEILELEAQGPGAQLTADNHEMAGNLKFMKFSTVKLCQAKTIFILIISGFMRLPAGDFNTLARNIFEIWEKVK
jgi:hypothetical protein